MRQKKGIDDDSGDGINSEQLSALIEAEQFASGLKKIEDGNGMNGRTFRVICEKRQLSNQMLVEADCQPDSVFTSDIKGYCNEDIEEDIEEENDLKMNRENIKLQSMIEFVSGALLTDLNVENANASQMEPDLIEEKKGEIVSMREYANLYKLDSKQTIAFEVICCTFMIDCIERITSNYGAGVHLSGKTGCKKTRELLTKALNFK